MSMKNRIIRSATWEQLADEDGMPTKELLDIYEDLSSKDVGTIITGYAYVIKDEQPNPGMMGIYDDKFIEAYKPLTELVHKNNCNIIMQIVYGGSSTRFNTKSRTIWGPSEVENPSSKITPKEISKNEIKLLINAFADSALRAKKSGFDGVQLHGAHGYLYSQFLSPFFNKREDEYGGSIENRARIIFETLEAIRDKVGEDFPVFIKINSRDYFEGGLDFEDCLWVCKELSSLGIDGIEISGGGVDKTRDSEAYYLKEATEIAKSISVPVILVGGNRTPSDMEKILNNTQISYLSMSKPFLREYDLVSRWKSGNLEKSKCITCNQCFKTEGHRYCIFAK